MADARGPAAAADRPRRAARHRPRLPRDRRGQPPRRRRRAGDRRAQRQRARGRGARARSRSSTPSWPASSAGSARRRWCRRSRRCASAPTRSSRRVLAENESRWESLTDADRERLERDGAARSPAALLHEPTLRIKRAADRRGRLPLRQRPARAVRARRRHRAGRRPSDADVTAARRARRRNAAASALAMAGCGSATRGSALALAQARAGRRALGGAEVVDGQDLRRRRARATRRASCAAIERALLDGEVDLGVHSAKDLPGRAARGPRDRRRARRARTPPTPSSARRARSTRCPRARGSAPSSLRRRAQLLAAAARPRGGRAARQRRHPPAQAAEGELRRDRARRRRAAAARARARRSRSASSPTQMTPAAGPGRAGARGARPTTQAGDAPRRDHATATRCVELTAERAVVAALDASCDTPVGVLARARRRAARDRAASPACPTAASGCATAVEGDPDRARGAGRALAERMSGCRRGELLARAEADRRRARAVGGRRRERPRRASSTWSAPGPATRA